MFGTSVPDLGQSVPMLGTGVLSIGTTLPKPGTSVPKLGKGVPDPGRRFSMLGTSLSDLGKLSREVWNIPALAQVPAMDYTGATPAGLAQGMPLVFLGVTTLLLSAAVAGRQRQLAG